MKTSKINKLYILSFVFTLHIAISAYINSSYLSTFVPLKYVGVLYTIASILILFLLSENSSILQNFGNRKTTIFLLFTNIVGLLGLIFYTNSIIMCLSFILFLSTNSLILFCIDIFIEHENDKVTIGRSRSIYLTITNLAWMLSPILGAILIGNAVKYINIYLVSLLAVSIATLGIITIVRRFKDKVYKKTPMTQTLRFLRENPHIKAITILNFLLYFFFASMVVYMPIYLHKNIGFNWDQIGVIFTIMLAPFVIFSYPSGILVDKYKIKKRNLLFIGFTILILSTMSIPFLGSKSVALWALVLFLTRTGASIIETVGEIYFFTHTKEEDAYLLGVYRDMSPIAYILAPLFASLVFIILPYKYLFLILAILMCVGFYFIPRLQHDHE